MIILTKNQNTLFYLITIYSLVSKSLQLNMITPKAETTQPQTASITTSYHQLQQYIQYIHQLSSFHSASSYHSSLNNMTCDNSGKYSTTKNMLKLLDNHNNSSRQVLIKQVMDNLAQCQSIQIKIDQLVQEMVQWMDDVEKFVAVQTVKLKLHDNDERYLDETARDDDCLRLEQFCVDFDDRRLQDFQDERKMEEKDEYINENEI